MRNGPDEIAQINSTCCSCTGPQFDSPHPKGSSQSSLNQVTGNLIFCFSMCVRTKHTYVAQTYIQAKYSYKNEF